MGFSRRKDVSCLVEDFIGVCEYWDCYYSTVRSLPLFPFLLFLLIVWDCRFRLNTASASSSGVDSYKHLRQMGKPLGATFLGISIMMLGVGFHRYFESQHWIIRGKFPASRGSVMLVALVTFCLMITSLVVVVVVEPGAYEKR